MNAIYYLGKRRGLVGYGIRSLIKMESVDAQYYTFFDTSTGLQDVGRKWVSEGRHINKRQAYFDRKQKLIQFS